MDDIHDYREELNEEAGAPEEAVKDHSADHVPVTEEIRKKANKYFFSKVAVNALLMILGAVLIAAKCKEDDIYTVKRVMNKEVLKIFYKYGINVPFPHVTVTQKGKK